MFRQLMKVRLKTLIVSNSTNEDIHAWDELQKKISSKNGVGAAATCSLKKVLANLKGKRLYWSFFLIKFQAWRPEISETFENIIFKDFWKKSARTASGESVVTNLHPDLQTTEDSPPGYCWYPFNWGITTRTRGKFSLPNR